jgi:hypothetical protein
MSKPCYPDFVIPRGNTSRYVYIFKNKGSYYLVTKKVLYAYGPYVKISTVSVPTKDIQTYINTVVALTY